MKFKMLLLLLSFIIQNLVFSQESLSEQQINRLADAGKLYGYVKYFHPYCQYKSINWDSAFVAAVPEIISSKTKSDYESALNKMLSVLKDPLTVVVKKPQQIKDNNNSINYSISDSILNIEMHNYCSYSDTWSYKKQNPSIEMSEALNSIGKLKGVIIDLRPVNGIGETSPSDIEDILFGGGIAKLFKGDIDAPSQRKITYETRVTRYFQQELATIYSGRGNKDIPIVFIVNNESILPSLVLSLQQSGKAAVLNESGTGDITGEIYQYYITDSLLVRLRASEWINATGNVGLSQEYEYAKENQQEITEKARNLIVNGYKYTKESNQPHIFPKQGGYFKNYSRDGLYPSLGYRVLAAAEIFTVIDNFYAYNHLMEGDWEMIYKKHLPLFLYAKDSVDYIKAITMFNANIKDSHSSFLLSMDDENHVIPVYPLIIRSGKYPAPIIARIFENQLIVTEILNDSAANSAGINQGDIILDINGKSPMEWIEAGRKYMAASNKESQTSILSKHLLEGNEGEVLYLKVQHLDGKNQEIKLIISDKFIRSDYSVKVKSPILRFVTDDIGYANLTRLVPSQVDSMFEMFRHTKAIIFDMRGYPKETFWQIAPRLTEKKGVVNAIFHIPKPDGPKIGKGIISDSSIGTLKQILPSRDGFVYNGKTVMLIDESAISQSEHSGMAFRAANGTKFIGTHSTGANGGAFYYPLPGGIGMSYTGQEVTFPDGQQLQRIGLQPDVEVHPTIKGIREGRDEILERAISYLNTGK